MPLLPILLLALSAPEGAAESIERALVTASDARARALCELAAALELPPARFGDRAACVEAGRRRVAAGAAWRVRREGDLLVVRLVEASGHLDRIRAWSIDDRGVRRRLHGAGTGDERRFPVPRGWPERGQVVLEASSSLIPGAPALLRQVARPAGSAPAGPPEALGLDPGPAAPDPAPAALEASSARPPWWLWVASAAAVGAVGLGVWQEVR